ncbi:hypothetical protein MLD38_026646 [Melastoma candidum]|uniref:Uncharacterized protein n=1 Tax=Melastoma candidum TaxID=119954 RepID=A0ACB9NZ86_9MYRT|nr:hypothetical protein MLD38_026646 [Melastoma candidum]
MRVISGGGWQPHGCRLPRFNATELLERSRNGRIVFAGDSLGRNQWESLLCMLSRSVSNLSNIYEVYGNPISKHKGYLSMMFADYNLTVNTTGPPFWSHPAVLLRTPLLMSKGPCGWMKCTFTQGFGPGRMCWCAMPVIGGTKTRRIRWGSIFRKKGALNMSMDVVEGFGRAMKTWQQWASEKIDRNNSHVFFRSYSPVHFRSATFDINRTKIEL